MEKIIQSYIKHKPASIIKWLWIFKTVTIVLSKILAQKNEETLLTEKSDMILGTLCLDVVNNSSNDDNWMYVFLCSFSFCWVPLSRKKFSPELTITEEATDCFFPSYSFLTHIFWTQVSILAIWKFSYYRMLNLKNRKCAIR